MGGSKQLKIPPGGGFGRRCKMYVCMYVCMYVYVHMYVCMYVCMYVVVCVCKYVHIGT